MFPKFILKLNVQSFIFLFIVTLESIKCLIFYSELPLVLPQVTLSTTGEVKSGTESLDPSLSAPGFLFSSVPARIAHGCRPSGLLLPWSGRPTSTVPQGYIHPRVGNPWTTVPYGFPVAWSASFHECIPICVLRDVAAMSFWWSPLFCLSSQQLPHKYVWAAVLGSLQIGSRFRRLWVVQVHFWSSSWFLSHSSLSGNLPPRPCQVWP